MNQGFIKNPELLTHEIIQAQVSNLKLETSSNATLTNDTSSISSKNSRTSRRSTFSGSVRSSNTNYYNTFEKSNFCAVQKRMPIKKPTIQEHKTPQNFQKVNGTRPTDTVNLQGVQTFWSDYLNLVVFRFLSEIIGP